MQEMIEDKVFYLYHTDFCAAATEALDGAVTVTEAGGLAGGVFSKKPSALLLAGVDPKFCFVLFCLTYNSRCACVGIQVPLRGPFRRVDEAP